MAIQTTYSRNFENAFAGQMGDSGYKRDTSATNTTGAGVAAGRPRFSNRRIEPAGFSASCLGPAD